MKNKCSKCPNPAKPNQRYCKKCHAEYMREWRKLQKIKDWNKIVDTMIEKYKGGNTENPIEGIKIEAKDLKKIKSYWNANKTEHKNIQVNLNSPYQLIQDVI